MSQATLSDRPYLNSNLFSGYYLDERIQNLDAWDCDEAAGAALLDLQELYDAESGLVGTYNEDTLLTSWIEEVVEILGFGRMTEISLPDTGGYVDVLLFDDDSARRDAAESYLKADEDETELFRRCSTVLEAKQWDAPFDQRFTEQRPYRNASHQIKHYLEKTPGSVEWGVLTNGRKWRLYGTKDYETETYFEVDLPELLAADDLEAFKYFYCFFRPDAFRDSAGTTFLDTVWSESETAAQELGEDLQDNVFTALRVLGRGFVETNDLDIDPDDDVALNRLKEQSLVLLYRLMFVLYAEARGLIHPENPGAEAEYDENFSLDALRLEVRETIGAVDDGFAEEYSEHSTSMWNRLSDLFGLIDEGEDSLGIPPYDGGLFDHDEHAFLADNEVSNRYLAEVIYRLSTTVNGEGRYVLADYADLDTRHLGSVYEGLLEHQFRIAPGQYAAVAADSGQVWKPATEVSVADAVETVPEGGLYVVNDEGERKATGAYYTPDYVVTYIVEETVGPLVEEIRGDLDEQGFEAGTQEYLGAFLRRVTDLKVLDPAMGSGHFLTKATGYLAEQVMTEVREFEDEVPVGFDEQHVRREIAKECIYGVDLNGMAVELAKLSMWLETLAADQPLAFLDHHFKEGNSLVGSDLEDIFQQEDEEPGQVPLDYDFERTKQQVLDRMMDIYQEFLAIQNETAEDVSEMKRKYAEIEEDELRQRLVAMANVRTAERFDLDVPAGAYERVARALEADSEWAEVEEQDWFRTAQGMAEEWDFFHWKLAFPEVFYGNDGQHLEEAGFDVVVGNPPWVGIRTGIIDRRIVEYLKRTEIYESATGQFDLAAVFIDAGLNLLTEDNLLGFVVPKRLATNEGYQSLRDAISNDRHLVAAIDLGVAFEGVNNDAMILISGETGASTTTFGERIGKYGLELWETESSLIRSMPFQILPVNNAEPEVQLVKKCIDQSSVRLESEISIDRGAECGMNHEAISKESGENSLPIVDHLDVGPYAVNHSDHYIDTTKIDSDTLKSMGIYTDTPKVLIRFLSPKLMAARDDFGYVSTNLVYHVQCGDHVDFLCGLLSSRLLNFWYFVSFQNDEVKFPHVQQSHINSLPVPNFSNTDDPVYEPVRDSLSENVDAIPNENTNTAYGIVAEASDKLVELYEEKTRLNLNLLDYITTTPNGPTLSEIGRFQPPETADTDSPLYRTKDDLENLRVGAVTCERAGAGTITVFATARYKPEDDDEHETDRWGYAETEPIEAFRVTDLSDLEADLVETFVPVAADEAGGFADFRETATKTNSLVDRLKALTLPEPSAVEADLRNYLDAEERAEELDEKIERTDDLIDEIVYELYGLTDEEIEIVEEAVDR